MKISFIVTTFNIAPYIEQCLNSLVPCLRPGDEVIVVDDCSTDRTDVIVEKRMAAGFGAGVGKQLILLGTNTFGGVGIPGNIGMSRAKGEAIFFVDGDDWIEPKGFLACRDAFEAQKPDILVANYLEHNESTGQSKHPSDMDRWAKLPSTPATPEHQRALALSMIGVPWRKFYRRDFVERHKLRFPEGPFFFEDNPFHWDVCRKAASIRFLDRVICRHRTNRPGQTMASTGIEFLAFFDHYETIRASVPKAEAALQAAALEWLVNNMSWHIGRMDQGVFWTYASRAALVLAGQEAHWAAIRARYAGSAIGGMVEALIRGEIAGTVAAWMADRTLQRMTRIEKQLDALKARGGADGDMGQRVKKMSEQVNGLRLIEEFRALRALHDGAPSEGSAPEGDPRP